jgi:hypothetical protein
MSKHQGNCVLAPMCEAISAKIPGASSAEKIDSFWRCHKTSHKNQIIDEKARGVTIFVND